MLWIAFITCVLVAITVAVHAAGLALLLRSFVEAQAPLGTGFWPVSWLLIRLTWWLLVIHLIEISVWALFYFLDNRLPDAESAFYFSGVTYTTTGYGELVLSRPWRLLAPVEAMTGILMCGLSTGFFFAVVSKVLRPGSATVPR